MWPISTWKKGELEIKFGTWDVRLHLTEPGARLGSAWLRTSSSSRRGPARSLLLRNPRGAPAPWSPTTTKGSWLFFYGDSPPR